MITSSLRLTPEQAVTLAALGDVLIPRADGMLSASEAGVGNRWVRYALAALPDHSEPLGRLLERARGKDPDHEVRRLALEEPERFATLVRVVVGAYYLSPKVRRAIGYPGPKRYPAPDDEADYYLRDGILDPVLARGQIYRPTPSG